MRKLVAAVLCVGLTACVASTTDTDDSKSGTTTQELQGRCNVYRGHTPILEGGYPTQDERACCKGPFGDCFVCDPFSGYDCLFF